MAYRVPGTDRFDLELDYAFSDEDIACALAVMPDQISAPEELTVCRNVFLPLTTACRYTCAYCTYYDVPGRSKTMGDDEIRTSLRRAAEAGCVEALFTFGDRPDDRYAELADDLERRGHGSLHALHLRACEWALELGLLPHSNPGDLSWEQLRDLKEVNASMGVMLETCADVPAHAGPRRKEPGRRLQTLEYAGRQKVPFTTGLLIGIGETWEDRAASLLCLRRLHEAYGHIQEVIIQNVVPNRRWKRPAPDVETMRRVVAMARATLPPEVELQVPPNLSDVEPLLDCGVGDLGGVSPLTDDYINPDYKWPALRALEALAARHGKRLVERLPVYPQYVNRADWLSDTIREALQAPRFEAFLATAVAG